MSEERTHSMVEATLLDESLKQLRLPTFLAQWRAIAEDAATTNQDYSHFLLALAQQEVAQRELNRKERRIKAAKLPALKELADFDFTRVPQLNKARLLQLAQGNYIPKAQTIIMLGNPGLGKTHLAISLALAACRQGYRVRFWNVAALINELLLAQENLSLNKFINAQLKNQLIILDELGFIPFSQQAGQLCFQLCAALYEKVALIITTNLPFAQWNKLFQDETLTLALLDRLTHHATILLNQILRVLVHQSQR